MYFPLGLGLVGLLLAPVLLPNSVPAGNSQSPTPIQAVPLVLQPRAVVVDTPPVAQHSRPAERGAEPARPPEASRAKPERREQPKAQPPQTRRVEPRHEPRPRSTGEPELRRRRPPGRP